MSLMVTSAAICAPISNQQAKKITRHFLENRLFCLQNPHTRGTAKDLPLQEVVSTDAYYIFNVGQQDGFVITSADDRMADILGYTDRGSFDIKRCPASLQYILNQYQNELKLLNRVPTSKSITATPQADRAPIAPLLKSIWSQYGPYNKQTPLHNGANCVTGCVATAAVQIMNYYRHPKSSPALNGYRTVSVRISVDALPATSFDWNDMLPTYRTDNTEMQQNEVAKLNRYVGQAVQMDYTKDDSGADSYLVVSEFPKLFGYAKDMHRVFRAQYSYDDWNNLIYNELQAKRPVYYFAEDATYGYGHAFICDGYQEGEFFHINWGWGGRFNGYYRLSVLSPREYGFEQLPSVFVREQGAIIGFKPATGTESCPMIVDVKEMKPLEDKERSTKGEQFTAQYTDIRCVNNYAVTFNAAWGIGFYQNGKLVETIQLEESEFGTDGKIKKYQNYFNIPGTIPNGVYSVKPVYRLEGESDWHPCGGAENLAQMMEITDTEMKNVSPKAQLKVVDVTFKGSKEAGRPLFVTLTLENSGPDLMDVFNLNFDWDPVASATAYVPAGQRTDVVFELYPKTPGTFEYNFDCDSYIRINAEGSITISDCKSKVIPVVEVKVEKCETGCFYAPVIKGKLMVTNKESEPYRGGFDLELRCRKGNTDKGTLENKISLMDEVPANKTIEIPFEIDNVVVGAQYAVYVNGYKMNIKDDYIQGGKMYKAQKELIVKSDFYLAKAATAGIVQEPYKGDIQPIYNLQGIKVGNNPYDFNKLPSGVYIIGKKKIIR